MCDFADGNGFKTSTMRLGADVIVFSRSTSAGYYILCSDTRRLLFFYEVV